MKKDKTQDKRDDFVDLLSITRALGIDKESFDGMLDGLPVYLWIHDEKHTIIFGNQAFEKKFGVWRNQKCYRLIMQEKSVCSCCPYETLLKNMKAEQCKLCNRGNFGYDINIVHVPITNKDGRKFIVTSNLHLKYLNTHKETSNINP